MYAFNTFFEKPCHQVRKEQRNRLMSLLWVGTVALALTFAGEAFSHNSPEPAVRSEEENDQFYDDATMGQGGTPKQLMGAALGNGAIYGFENKAMRAAELNDPQTCRDTIAELQTIAPWAGEGIDCTPEWFTP